ncbi:MAG TPA: molecular chaperone DnaK [Dehalococcoidia bacterium]|nr:molecular chaperone DnaK [Dehalococcoidia bacterium]
MADFAELYERLKEERVQLNDELEQIEAKIRPINERREGSPFGKREEEATEAFELERRLALEKRLMDALAEVEHALEKYEAGSYGICDRCGQPIEPARLEALPQASLCLDCKASQMKNARSRLER